MRPSIHGAVNRRVFLSIMAALPFSCTPLIRPSALAQGRPAPVLQRGGGEAVDLGLRARHHRPGEPECGSARGTHCHV
jgi:hypothetical protein